MHSSQNNIFLIPLKEIAKALASKGHRCYIVGGWCRDTLLQKETSGDVDLTTDATPKEMYQVLHVIKEVGKKYGTLIIKSGSQTFEITSFRKDIGILDGRRPVQVEFTRDLKLDAQRRDFTMNAIYYDLLTDTFIDPVGGVSDLKNGVIRFVGNPQERIDEDALRILRYVRLKHTYELTDHQDYLSVISKNMSLLQNISRERIKEEFDKILLLPSIKALEDLKVSGFFKIYFPEIEALSETPGGPRHHLEGDVWVHTLLTLQVLKNTIQEGFHTINLAGEEEVRFFHESEKRILNRTLLLHDIGKNKCFSRDECKDVVHYFGHETLGAQMLDLIFSRFIFSNQEKKMLRWLIKEHLNVFKIYQMRPQRAKKLMMHPFFPLLMIVGKADHEGRIPSDPDTMMHLLKLYQAFRQDLSRTQFYTGHDVLALFPDLQASAIKNKLQALNQQILAKISLKGAEFGRAEKSG